MGQHIGGSLKHGNGDEALGFRARRGIDRGDPTASDVLPLLGGPGPCSRASDAFRSSARFSARAFSGVQKPWRGDAGTALSRDSSTWNCAAAARVWLVEPTDFWQSCMVIQGSNSRGEKNRVTVRRNFARLVPLPRIRGHEPDLSMSDRPLPQENLFLGSVMDQGATH